MSNIFAPNARKIWEAIPLEYRTRILNNVWCGNCIKTTTIVNYFGQLKDGNLVLEGECKRCGKAVARFIENE
jgi:hypothetical protein